VVLLVGFPLALIFAWGFELTPEGIKSTNSVLPAESITHTTGQKLNYSIITLLSLVVLFLLIDNYLIEDGSQTSTRAELEAAESGSQPGETAAPVMDEEPQREVLPNSVAVLPFENLSPDSDNAYFAAGIHDELRRRS
jgi:hypothetical protein